MQFCMTINNLKPLSGTFVHHINCCATEAGLEGAAIQRVIEVLMGKRRL